MRFRILIKILFTLALIAFWLLKSPKKETIEIVTEKTETITLKKHLDSLQRKYDSLDQVKREVYYDTITKMIRVPLANQPKKATETTKKLNVKKDTFQLKNAKVVSTIFSEGKVLQHDLKLETIDSLITRETITTKTITKYKSENTWFLNFEPRFSLIDRNFTGMDVILDYTIKNKLRLGGGLGYDKRLPANDQIQIKLKIGFSL